MPETRQIVCPRCAAVNRVPRDRPAAAARCGRCREPLFAGVPVEADRDLFARHIGRGDLPVLVDVWAPWCGPCRMMAPAFAAAAGVLEPDMRLLKLNSEAEPVLASELGIRGIPTLLLYAGGREIARVSGAMDTPQIVSWTRDRLAAGPGGSR